MEGYKIVGYIVAIAGAISYIIILCLGGNMSISVSGRRMKITQRMPVKTKKIFDDTSINIISLALETIIFQYRNNFEEIFISEKLQRVNKIIDSYNLTRIPGLSLPSKLPENIESELLNYLNKNGQTVLSNAIVKFSKVLNSSANTLKEGK
jgi:hypothetical protein